MRLGLCFREGCEMKSKMVLIIFHEFVGNVAGTN